MIASWWTVDLVHSIAPMPLQSLPVTPFVRQISIVVAAFADFSNTSEAPLAKMIIQVASPCHARLIAPIHAGRHHRIRLRWPPCSLRLIRHFLVSQWLNSIDLYHHHHCLDLLCRSGLVSAWKCCHCCFLVTCTTSLQSACLPALAYPHPSLLTRVRRTLFISIYLYHVHN